MINGRDLEVGDNLGLLWIIPEVQSHHMGPIIKAHNLPGFGQRERCDGGKVSERLMVQAVKMEEGPNAREFGSHQKLEKARNKFSPGASRRLTDTP